MNIFFQCISLESNYKYLLLFIEIIHVIISIIACIGIFFPKNLLPYTFIWYSGLLISWEYFDGECWITYFINKYFKLDESMYLINLSYKLLKSLVQINLMLIIFFYMKPQYSFFALLSKLFRFLEKYN